MKKTKIWIVALLVFVIAATFTFAACQPPEDNSAEITLNNVNGNGITTFKMSEIVNKVTKEWHGDVYLNLKSTAWVNQLAKYADVKANGFGTSNASGVKATIDPGTGAVTYNYAESTKLNMAVGYDGPLTSISYNTLPGTSQSSVTLPYTNAANSSNQFVTGNLKPVWQELSSRLGIDFKDVNQLGTNRLNEFNNWNGVKNYTSQAGNVHVLMGPLSDINDAGRAGDLVNIAQYLDYMPNFKQFLIDNPLVYLSLVADTTTGAIYSMPYFDGYDDIERYFMLRTDWTATLLDNGTSFTHGASSVKEMNDTIAYEAYMPATGEVEVDVANNAVAASVTGTTKVTKNYDASLAHFKTAYTWYADGTSGNIVDIAAAYRKLSTATYDGLVNLLREYIDVAYDNFYGATRSNLFCGTNSAWDADELVILTHCVIGQAYEFNDAGDMAGLFVRETNSNDRRYDIIRMGACMFGVRGIESRNDNLYFDKDGNLIDARQKLDTYELALKLNTMFQEGLIEADLANPVTTAATSASALIQGNKGFCEYDYVQSQTGYTLAAAHKDKLFQPIINPVALWNDGSSTTGEYMRFTESWRSVKTDGACITKKCDLDQLTAAIAMFDYFYTTEGKILMTYGPDEFLKANTGYASGSENWVTGENLPFVTAQYNDTWMPVINEEFTKTDGLYYFNNFQTVSGSYTNFARRYLGTTLCISEKMQSFEYQLTDPNGIAGEGKVSTAIKYGLIKHVELDIQENMWYTSVPVTFATSKEDDALLNGFLNIVGGSQYFSQNSGKTVYNLFVEMVTADVK